ncbi:MAG: hypothetical protein N3A59_05795 [Thermodesulfovibrionales bacterium]|nr:hypothetical protein [Thermodesulfovibrionales bacterium]
MVDEELKMMILEYMQKGFLDNIIDMFKHDKSLIPLIVDMIKDERIRVRIGAVALVEELSKTSKKELTEIIPLVSALLNDPNPTIRGDASYLIEIIEGESN